MTIDRRSLLTGTASLLAAGTGASPRLLIGPDLKAVKWYLMPALWATFNGTGINADIEIAEHHLIVTAWKGADRWQEARHAMAFGITEKNIIDGTHIAHFTSMLPVLKEKIGTAQVA